MFQLLHHIKSAPIAVAVLFMSSCGKSNPNINGGNSDPVRVRVMSVAQFSSDVLSDSFSGTIEAGSSTTPGFSVAGTISRIHVAEGQRVNKGQLIATVDGSSLRNSYDIAQATLREAQDAYNRMKKLHDANALPDMQWVSVQEKLKQAEAAAAIARTGMNDANLYAPISGVIARKLADVGQTAVPGLPIVEIMDVGTLKVKITVPESELAELKTGTNATVTAGGHTYSGKLIEKGVAANSLSRNYDIKFQITDPDSNLLPGMICSVSVENANQSAGASKSSDMILPPQAVVLDWNNEYYVWVKKNGVASRQKVILGGLDSRGIIIAEGISPNDSVIVEGQQKLSSGLKVVSVN